MDIGLFGGSFNPPHVAHRIVAEVVRDQFDLSEVWWIPNATPPHKPDDELVAVEHRLAMTRRVVESNPHFRICDLEVQRDGVSYTVETLRVLQDQHPDTDFALERVPLIVYKRPGGIESVAEPRFANRVRYVAAPVMEVSGTEVRARRRAGRSIRYLVPDAVRTYIDAHDLYRGAE
ncbi:MAG: nicotinic acid mononucleotide adenylyltransferase [Bacteroidetes bacterium SW_7_64_58]|nr:MAG: nicotinic acid mononucleotide adenylyltransferase [Bacteroidetes bacterium SW_7_64_58]